MSAFRLSLRGSWSINDFHGIFSPFFLSCCRSAFLYLLNCICKEIFASSLRTYVSAAHRCAEAFLCLLCVRVIIHKCGSTQKHIETSIFVLTWVASSGTQSWLLGYLWFVLFPVHLVNAQALQRQGGMSFFFFFFSPFLFYFLSNFSPLS